jgi:AcrR family transcriptional regulator
MLENGAEIRQRIISSAREQFLMFGFTKVSVEEIATKMGMSKKTIYKYFPRKEDLVREVIESTLRDIEMCCRRIVEDDSLDFVEKLQKMMSNAAFHISALGRPLIEDLEKNVPHVWKEISDFRSNRIKEDFGKLFNEGVRKGFFRNDIDPILFIMIYDTIIENIISPEMLSRVPFTALQAYDTIVKIIFEGILTKNARPKYLPPGARN